MFNKFFYLAFFALVCISVAAAENEKSGFVGGQTELSGDELKTATDNLDAALAKLATGDGPSFKLGKVTKVTTQVVAGTLVTYNVELIDGDVTKECVVRIWSKPWLKENGTNVKIECEADDLLDSNW